MAKRKIKSPAVLGADCETWNARHPAGTLVKYWPGRRPGEYVTHTTAGPAYVLSGHSAVIMLVGVAGCVALDHCEAYLPIPDFKKLMKGAD